MELRFLCKCFECLRCKLRSIVLNEGVRYSMASEMLFRRCMTDEDWIEGIRAIS